MTIFDRSRTGATFHVHHAGPRGVDKSAEALLFRPPTHFPCVSTLLACRLVSRISSDSSLRPRLVRSHVAHADGAVRGLTCSRLPTRDSSLPLVQSGLTRFSGPGIPDKAFSTLSSWLACVAICVVHADQSAKPALARQAGRSPRRDARWSRREGREARLGAHEPHLALLIAQDGDVEVEVTDALVPYVPGDPIPAEPDVRMRSGVRSDAASTSRRSTR